MRFQTTCCAVLLGLLAPGARAQPIATERLEAAMTIAGQETRNLPTGEERLRVVIDGQHATTTLTQVYENTAGSVVEGQYRLQPGSGSHVDAFAYWNGEHKIVGEVFERQAARQVYENVTQQRRDPGLLEEDGEGRFAFKVFPIQPREKKRIELRWTKWLDRRGQTVRYRAPLSRADADIVVELTGPVKNVRSATHRFASETTATGIRLRAERGGASELAIDYDLDEAPWTPDVYVHAGGAADGWFALSLAAGAMADTAVAPKDVTIVIDRSGSMSGEPLAHAKAAARDMIRMLDARDRVNVVAFSDEVDPLFAAPRSLDADTRATATRFVDKLAEGGGTDIVLALATAIKSQQARSGRPRVVVFMTDGQSDIDKAMRAASTDTGDVRLFTLGLGKDVNKPLLSRLAAHKRGRFVYIERPSAIEPEVARLAASISKPLLVDVSFEVEGAQAVRVYPRSLPDLFAEDELRITGRIRGTGTAKLTVRGKLAGKEVAFSRAVDLRAAKPRPWVGALWAQARVDHLLEEIALGATAPELVEEVTNLALAYNFVTPFTAFLAIPESELGTSASTVADARARKKKIMVDNPDVAALHDTGGGGGGEAVLITATAPMIDQASTKTGITIDQNYTRNIPTGRTFESAMTAAAGTQRDQMGSARPASRRHGCAGCDGGGSGASLGVALLALRFRRRRR